MKLDKALFGITLAIATVVGIAMLVPEAPEGHGVTHPEFPSMLSGGSGPARHGPVVLWLGWAFVVLQTLSFAVLMAFGVQKGKQLRGLGKPLLYCTTAHLVALTWIVLSYQRYTGETTHSLFLGFPAPTALLLYVLWPLTMVFSFCFVIGFKRWVLSEEDLAEFERLLAKRRRVQVDSNDAGQVPASAPTEEY